MAEDSTNRGHASIDELMARLGKSDKDESLKRLARPTGTPLPASRTRAPVPIPAETPVPVPVRRYATHAPNTERPTLPPQRRIDPSPAPQAHAPKTPPRRSSSAAPSLPPRSGADADTDLVVPVSPDPPGTPPQRGHISQKEQDWLLSQLETANWIRQELAPELSLDLPLERTDELLEAARKKATEALVDYPQFARALRTWIDETLDEVFGLGPLERFLRSDTVTEIMVNGPYVLMIERQGKLVESGRKFLDDDHVERIIKRIVLPLGRDCSADQPLVDARLPDGSRVNAVLRPCAIDGPSITIRKFSKQKLTMDDLVGFGALSADMKKFLEAIVVARQNVVVSGGTGSGKTTLINCLSGYIPEGERVVTIEDAAELQLSQRNVVRLETKKPSPSSPTTVSVRDCVVNALRMRPERIVVGECRAGEALDMLQAMNTGHDGSMTTVHANDPRSAISRLETLCMMAGFDLPIVIIRKQIVSAIGFFVQASRLRDGSRKITSICEVVRLEGDVPILSEIYKFDDRGERPDGKVLGMHISTGNRPTCEATLKRLGYDLHYRN